MDTSGRREMSRRFATQHGVLSRSQLYAMGIGPSHIRARLANGEWELVSPRVIRAVSFGRSPEQDLMGLVLSASQDAVVSHRSAAWLWRIGPVPQRHEVSTHRRGFRSPLPGLVHCLRQWPVPIVLHGGFAVTNPLRTIVDVSAVLPLLELEGVIDKALALNLVSLEGIRAELSRLTTGGRQGIGALRWALRWREDAGAGHPSVLEAMTLRLLHRAGIVPLGVEVQPHSELSYRLDVLLRPGLALEVDGYSYHHSAQNMAEDARRRNRLQLAGTQTLVYTWRDIAYDGPRVVLEVRMAMSQRVPAQPGRGRGGGPVVTSSISKLKLDLHDIYNRGYEIDKALREMLDEAVRIKATSLEIIPGKGSGQLKKRVLRFLDQKDIRPLYHRVEKDSDNWGRIWVYFRWK